MLVLQQSEVLKTLKNIKHEYQEIGIDIIGLFGSVARNENNPNSDIDILYDTKKGINNLYDKKQNLKQKLKDIFHTDIDLASIKYLKPYAKDEIMKDIVYV